jgi:hypothetical protein
MRETPVPQRFLRIRENRFTVAFREAITIAARFARSMGASLRDPMHNHYAIDGWRFREQRIVDPTLLLPGRVRRAGDDARKSPAGLTVDDPNSNVSGNETAGHVPGQVERGRRRTRQEQISTRLVAR